MVSFDFVRFLADVRGLRLVRSMQVAWMSDRHPGSPRSVSLLLPIEMLTTPRGHWWLAPRCCDFMVFQTVMKSGFILHSRSITYPPMIEAPKRKFTFTVSDRELYVTHDGNAADPPPGVTINEIPCPLLEPGSDDFWFNN